MKKWSLLILALVLTFSLGNAAFAADDAVGVTVYAEYASDDGTAEGPTLGLDWEVTDQFVAQFSYQFEGDDDDAGDPINLGTFSIGGEYSFLEYWAASLTYELTDDDATTTLGLSGSYPITDPLSVAASLEYGITNYDQSGIDDTKAWTWNGGLDYQALEALSVSLHYELEHEESASEDSKTAILGAEYAFDPFAVYGEYEFDPKTITVGVSYSF